MSIFDHIIVPFDGTTEAQHAALVGADLARELGAELVVATVDEMARPPQRTALKARAASRSDARATVWVEPERSTAAGLETMTSYRPNALICMATHARTGVRRAVYGSLDEQLLRVIDTPLLLIGPKCRQLDVSKWHHLVVSIDHAEGSATAIALAARWSRSLTAGATVVYTRDPDELVVDFNQRITNLVANCRAVDKLVIERRNQTEGLLDIARHSPGSIIVTTWHDPSGLNRVCHDTLFVDLCHDSPAPILVQRALSP